MTSAGFLPGSRAIRGGLALAGLYAATVLATAALTGHPVRPLFDGIGGSLPYKWMAPPWYIGANVKPAPSHTDIAFENGASPLVGVNSDDAQLLLNLPQGALPSEPGATAVRATFTPLNPEKLGKPPGTMRPDGNAYKVDLAYQPSGTPLRQTTTSGNVVMIVPADADKMLFSLDGRDWTELPTHQLGDPTTVGSAFNAPGYYLVGTSLPEFANPNKGRGGTRTLGLVFIVIALTLLLGYVVPALLRRSRAAQAAERSGGRGRPGRPGGAAPGRRVRRR